MGDFVAIDVETANADLGSICAIGLAAFDAGVCTKRLHFLVDPEDEFDPMNVAIHGIEPEQVIGAPKMERVFPVLASALAGRTVVHHTAFDRVAIQRASARVSIPHPECRWLDSALIARRAWAQYARRGYGLANICGDFGIPMPRINGIHHAQDDAEAAGNVVLRAMADSGIDLEGWHGRVLQSISGEAYGRYAREGRPDGPLNGETIVFTGKLTLSREEAATLAASLGCDVADRVSKATTILVVGEQDLRVLAGHPKSSKHRRAEELISDGQDLRILGEGDFQLLVAILTPERLHG